MAEWKMRWVVRPRVRAPACWSAVFLGGLLAYAGPPGGQRWVLDSHCRMENAVMAVYLEDSTKAAAVVRVDRVYCDFQRRGFFRIGALPAVIMQGLNIEVRDSAQLARVFTNAVTLFKVKPGVKDAVEVKGFALSFESKPCGRVLAKWACLATGDEWRLEEGLIDGGPGAVVGFKRALLSVTGPAVGTLSCDTTNGPVTLNLISVSAERENPK